MVRKQLLSLVVLALSVVVIGSALVAQPAIAADKTCGNSKDRILTFPFWYRGIINDKCEFDTSNSNWIGLLVLNIGDIAAQLVAYVSVGFIIYGGIKYILSAGTSAGVESAKKTITNAIIGLVISISAVIIVNLIFGVFL